MNSALQDLQQKALNLVLAAERENLYENLPTRWRTAIYDIYKEFDRISLVGTVTLPNKDQVDVKATENLPFQKWLSAIFDNWYEEENELNYFEDIVPNGVAWYKRTQINGPTFVERLVGACRGTIDDNLCTLLEGKLKELEEAKARIAKLEEETEEVVSVPVEVPF